MTLYFTTIVTRTFYCSLLKWEVNNDKDGRQNYLQCRDIYNKRKKKKTKQNEGREIIVFINYIKLL